MPRAASEQDAASGGGRARLLAARCFALVALFAGALVVSPAAAAAPRKHARIVGLRARGDANGAVVEVLADRPLSFTTLRLQQPPRVVLDFADAEIAFAPRETVVEDGTVRRMGAAQAGAKTARVVIELAVEAEFDVHAAGPRLEVRIARARQPVAQGGAPAQWGGPEREGAPVAAQLAASESGGPQEAAGAAAAGDSPAVASADRAPTSGEKARADSPAGERAREDSVPAEPAGDHPAAGERAREDAAAGNAAVSASQRDARAAVAEAEQGSGGQAPRDAASAQRAVPPAAATPSASSGAIEPASAPAPAPAPPDAPPAHTAARDPAPEQRELAPAEAPRADAAKAEAERLSSAREEEAEREKRASLPTVALAGSKPAAAAGSPQPGETSEAKETPSAAASLAAPAPAVEAEVPAAPPATQPTRAAPGRGPASAPRLAAANQAVAITGIGFRPLGAGAVVVRSDRPLEYDVDAHDRQIVLHLRGAAIPLPNNRRPLDTSFFGGPVDRIVPAAVPGGVDLRIELRETAEFQLDQAGGVLTMAFSR